MRPRLGHAAPARHDRCTNGMTGSASPHGCPCTPSCGTSCSTISAMTVITPEPCCRPRSLVRRLNVGRTTARRALDALIADGYAQRYPAPTGPCKAPLPRGRRPTSQTRRWRCHSAGSHHRDESRSASVSATAGGLTLRRAAAAAGGHIEVKDRRFRLMPVDGPHPDQVRSTGPRLSAASPSGRLEQVGIDGPPRRRCTWAATSRPDRRLAGANLVHAGDLVAGLLLERRPPRSHIDVLHYGGRFYTTGDRADLRGITARLDWHRDDPGDHDLQPVSIRSCGCGHNLAITVALGAGLARVGALRADGRASPGLAPRGQ